MTLPKKVIEHINHAPVELRADAIKRAYAKRRTKALKTLEANYIKRIQAHRAIREQALAIGNIKKAREAQVEVRYLQRKLDALRGKR